VSKDGLKNKREKLRADRFKVKNTVGNLRSKTEVTLMKKLQKKGPVAPVKTTKEIFDVWGGSGDLEANTSYQAPSKKDLKFRDFSNRSITKIRSVVAPLAGQSFNPALNAHKTVLK
jgi:hypothetical protein